jgi:8-oxo-dGTP pyrophosphatase MutT (NUDIX family)
MDINNYQRVCHSALWFGKKIALAKVLKEAYHKGWYCDSGGKIEKNETVLRAVQRETEEETGIFFLQSQFEFVDCFIYNERKIKTYLFKVELDEYAFHLMKHTEPTKLSPWKLYTVKQALKLPLMPSVKFYLESL